MMRAVLIGNYGDRNLGDEVLRTYMVGAYPECSWTILSARPAFPNEVPRLPIGARSFFTQWWRTLLAFWNADVLVFGGGTLFTDAESLLACFLWGLHAFVGFLLQKPLVFAYQGIGPFRTRIGERIARWCFRRAAYISVRDSMSLQRALTWGLSQKVLETADPGILLFDRYREHHPGVQEKMIIAIPRAKSTDSFMTAVQQAHASHPESSVMICHLQLEQEGEISTRLQRSFPQASIVSPSTPEALMNLLSSATLVITERYHGAIAAMSAMVPFVIISSLPGDKLEALQRLATDPLRLHRMRIEAENGQEDLRSFFSSFYCTK